MYASSFMYGVHILLRIYVAMHGTHAIIIIPVVIACLNQWFMNYTTNVFIPQM